MLHSVDGALLAIEARRRYVRVAQIGRAITVVIDGVEHPFSLTNISSRGAAGTCDVALKPGAFFTFIFENGSAVRGEVRWSSENMIGIFFAMVLPTDVMTPPARVRALVPRAPRYSVARQGMLMVKGARRPCIVRNVSTTGMMLETVMPPQAGQVIRFACGDFAVEGEVRWVRHNLAGVRFLEAIDLNEFEEQGFVPPTDVENDPPMLGAGLC